MNLKNKVALITGGARIGIDVGQALAEQGCHVVFSYRNSIRSAKEGAERVKRENRKALLVKADVTRDRDVKRLIKTVQQRMRRLDILVNMASIYERRAFTTLTESAWDEDLNANLKSAYLTVLRAAALLKRSKGRVVNFADWVAASGRPRYPSFVPYYTAKAGLIGLTEAQALDLAPSVLVNAIAPGPILPPETLTNEETKNIKNVTPLKKWGGAREISKAVLFLVKTDFVTGECIRVDGGRHLY